MIFSLDIPSFVVGVVFGVILLFAAISLLGVWRGKY